MNVVVKICGLSTEETIDAAIEAGADMVGLVLFARSPRNVTVKRAAALADRARGRAEIVALTVDMDDAELAAVVNMVNPDWLQLHGAESVERVKAVREAFSVKVMKALPIATKADLGRLPAYAAVADRLLLDGKPAAGSDRPGGLGVAFDWRILAGFDPGIPYLLAGGLDPANVGAALELTGAPGVDVSSGVETAPGKKDPDLIRAFVAAARHAAMAARAEKVPS
jgi:phosphoribosylanthranilate isomerase